MKKYYLLNCTDEPVLHIFDAPEQRITETIAIIYSREASPPQDEWDRIKRKLNETGAFSAGEIGIGWFEATPAKQDALAVILGKLDAIRVGGVSNQPTITSGVIKPLSPSELASMHEADSRPAEGARAPFEKTTGQRAGMSIAAIHDLVSPAPESIPVRVPINGGIILEGEAGGVFKVVLNGKILAATKPGGQFLVVADDATDGTWLLAAQHTLNAINSGELKL